MSDLLKRITKSLSRPAECQTLKDQAIRQAASGAAATLADISAFKLCLVIGLHVLIAALISMTLALLVNFAISRRYVFGEVELQKKRAMVQLALYVPAALAAIGLTQLVLYVFNMRLGMDPMLVKIFVAVPLVFLWTLLCGKYLLFDKRPNSTTESSKL